MVERQNKVAIVTDGSVEVPLQFVADGGVAIVPRRVRQGRRLLERRPDGALVEVSPKTGASEANRNSKAILLGSFLDTYQGLISHGRPIISIHGSSPEDAAGHVARVVARLLQPEGNILVFNAKGAGAGAAYLVQAAARAAREGLGLEELMNLLIRLQAMTLSLVLTPIVPRWASRGAWRRLVGWLPGVETLISFAGERANVVAQGLGFERTLTAYLQAHPRSDGNQQLWVRHWGNESKAGEMVTLFERAFDLRSASVGRAGLNSHVGSKAVEALFYPSEAELGRLIHWAQSWAGQTRR